jgi:hypothetical protein
VGLTIRPGVVAEGARDAAADKAGSHSDPPSQRNQVRSEVAGRLRLCGSQQVGTCLCLLERFDTTEQTDLAYRLGQVDKDSSLSQEESKELRDTFDALKQLISLTFLEQPYQLIPLGSFIIGCVSNRNKTIDCYIYFESRLGLSSDGFVENTLIGEGLEAALRKQNRNEIEQYSVEVSKEDKDTVFFSSLNTSAKVRLVSIQLVQENGETKINRYSASIFHSNWLIENFNKSESAWQVVKLFRLIRVWK